VCVLDRIRSELGGDDNYGEFCWFVREYPRIYRYHLDHAKLRLRAIYSRYVAAHRYFAKQLEPASENLLGTSVGGQQSNEIYWDFETYLSALNSALDVLARIIGTAYAAQTPVSFNKLCSKAALSGLVDLLREANTTPLSIAPPALP
jgi:hypothetical protein